jgi:hypothetical protein
MPDRYAQCHRNLGGTESLAERKPKHLVICLARLVEYDPHECLVAIFGRMARGRS